MNFRGVKGTIALLFLIISVSSFGYEESILEYEGDTLRVQEECGCERGTLYLYSVGRDGGARKERLQTYPTQEACEEVLQTRPPSRCPR